LEELSQGIVKTQPVFLNQSIVKNQPKVREDTPISVIKQPCQPSQPLLDKFNEQWKQRDMSQPYIVGYLYIYKCIYQLNYYKTFSECESADAANAR